MRISAKYSVAIHCLVFIHEYGECKKVTSNLLALSTGCNPVVIRNIISEMKKGGILTIRPGTGGARLACPASEITLYRIYELLEPTGLQKLIGLHPFPSTLCPIGRDIHSILEVSYEKFTKVYMEASNLLHWKM